MKQSRSKVSLVRLTGLLGITRQSYYQHFWRQQEMKIEHQLILSKVKEIRSFNPAMGTRKLQVMLHDFMMEHQIKMGRDALFDLLAENYMLVRRRRRKVFTTNSRHWLRRYPNLVKGLEIIRVNQVWVSDITYLKTRQGYVYISFITDACSHKIMGYNLANNLETVNTLKALKMAIDLSLKQGRSLEGLIHHSDQGLQYCSNQYVALLKKHAIQISMSDKGEPLQNPIAERVNGIIKYEYLFYNKLENKQSVKELLDISVLAYNFIRPHLSCNMLTPDQAHQLNQPLTKLWKNYYRNKTEKVNPCQD
jgi:putative transposase